FANARNVFNARNCVAAAPSNQASLEIPTRKAAPCWTNCLTRFGKIPSQQISTLKGIVSSPTTNVRVEYSSPGEKWLEWVRYRSGQGRFFSSGRYSPNGNNWIL